MNKKVRFGIFIIFLITAIFIRELYIFDKHTYARYIQPQTYIIKTLGREYEFNIKNIQLPVNYYTKDEIFAKPYITIKNNQENNQDYVLILSGGPWMENGYFSRQRGEKFKKALKKDILKFFDHILQKNNLIIIDARINDLGDKMKCENFVISPSDFYNIKGKNLKINCEKNHNEIIQILGTRENSKDIYNILEKENINKVHLIGESYGAYNSVHFINSYPDKIKSFVPIYGDIIKNNDYYALRKYVLKNLDEIALDQEYNWPFSKPPSFIADWFNNYLHRYSEDIVLNNNSRLAYIPLGDSFASLHQPKNIKNIVFGSLKINPLELIDCCEKQPNSLTGEGFFRYDFPEHICEMFTTNWEPVDVEIPSNIPVQIIYGGLDMITPGDPNKDVAFRSNNQGIIYHQDARHFDENCIKKDYHEIIPKFLSELKPVTYEDRCGGWKFYDGNDLSDADLFDFNTPPP